MWGETIFGIEEEDYESDYIAQLTEQMNIEQPKEEKLKRFKQFFDEWADRLEKTKKLMPQFKDKVARRMINLEMSRLEQNMGIFDVLEESKIVSEDFYKIANVFTNLWGHLVQAEKRVPVLYAAQKRDIRQTARVRRGALSPRNSDQSDRGRLRDDDQQGAPFHQRTVRHLRVDHTRQ